MVLKLEESVVKIKRAIVSVSDKDGIVPFCRTLSECGIEIISTGGTASVLEKSGIPILVVSDVTKFPEMMNGRVKTLHPMIHGGILGIRDNSEHKSQADKNGIKWIDLVVVNLYPFEKTAQKQDPSVAELIEEIDIGGPTLIRSAAKNFKYVTVVTDPSDYSRVAEYITESGEVPDTVRAELAVKAFRRTAEYDALIDKTLSEKLLNEERAYFRFGRGKTLRYGENSHQKAMFYVDENSEEISVAKSEVIHGKEMSFNNYVDANAALEVVKEFDETAVAVIKHTNPCGLATGKTPREALERAWAGDPVSAFGSVISCNRTVDKDFASFLRGKNEEHISYIVNGDKLVPQKVPSKFVEVIAAPDFNDEALKILTKTKNIRLLKTGPFNTGTADRETFKKITGGLLVMDRDSIVWQDFLQKTNRVFEDDKKQLAKFSYIAVKHTKSNAIVLAREYSPGSFQVFGMGAGQPNRVDALRKLSLTKVRENLQIEYDVLQPSISFEEFYIKSVEEMVLASDAFFPFDDTVRTAGKEGVRYIIQPGGSKRDQDSIDACNELDIAMAFTGIRHFRH